MKYKKAIKGRYWISYELSKEKETRETIQEVHNYLKGNKALGYEIFFGEHKKHGKVLVLDLDVYGTTVQATKSLLSETKKYITSKLGKINLIIELNKDVI